MRANVLLNNEYTSCWKSVLSKVITLLPTATTARRSNLYKTGPAEKIHIYIPRPNASFILPVTANVTSRSKPWPSGDRSRWLLRLGPKENPRGRKRWRTLISSLVWDCVGSHRRQPRVFLHWGRDRCLTCLFSQAWLGERSSSALYEGFRDWGSSCGQEVSLVHGGGREIEAMNQTFLLRSSS